MVRKWSFGLNIYNSWGQPSPVKENRQAVSLLCWFLLTSFSEMKISLNCWTAERERQDMFFFVYGADTGMDFIKKRKGHCDHMSYDGKNVRKDNSLYHGQRHEWSLRGRRAFPLMHKVGLVAEESHEKSPNKGKYLSLVSFREEVVQVLHHTISPDWPTWKNMKESGTRAGLVRSCKVTAHRRESFQERDHGIKETGYDLTKTALPG